MTTFIYTVTPYTRNVFLAGATNSEEFCRVIKSISASKRCFPRSRLMSSKRVDMKRYDIAHVLGSNGSIESDKRLSHDSSQKRSYRKMYLNVDPDSPTGKKFTT